MRGKFMGAILVNKFMIRSKKYKPGETLTNSNGGNCDIVVITENTLTVPIIPTANIIIL